MSSMAEDCQEVLGVYGVKEWLAVEPCLGQELRG